MSLPGSATITCGNCLTESKYFGWASTHSFGSCDLDTRPPDDFRFAMKDMLVKRCRKCNYCYSDISAISTVGKEILMTDEYLNQLNNSEFSKTANAFLCKAMILEAEGKLTEAGWSTLHSAWCCDDDTNNIQAKYCRIRAIELFQMAINIGKFDFDSSGEFTSLLVDLYRRSENIPVARKLAEHRLKIEDNDLFQKILYFEICLCKQHDIGSYKIDDAQSYFIANYQEAEGDEFDDEDDYDYDNDNNNNNNNEDYYSNDDSESDRDYFNTMTDGNLGDFDTFKEKGGTMDDIDTWAGK